MSQIDIRDAKRALAARLEMWGVTDEPVLRANGFIDDLVARGWQMAPFRETRPMPPKRSEACMTCGYHIHRCICGDKLAGDESPAPKPRADAKSGADTCRAILRASGVESQEIA